MPNDHRQFLQNASAAAILSAASYERGLGANDRMVVGVVSPGGMGTNHIRTLVGQKDVTISHVCDVDANRLAAAVKNAAAQGQEPQPVGDMRRILDRKEVVAFFNATPDHWHAPGTQLGLDAGKHVYVEKPCSHNIREGRLMIEAARRTRKICQVGTQTRSSDHAIEATKLLHAGEAGEILSTRVWNSLRRRDIGKMKPSDPPATCRSAANVPRR